MSPRDGAYRDLFDAAREQGWRVERLANSHHRFVPPDPKMPIVVVSSTPRSDL